MDDDKNYMQPEREAPFIYDALESALEVFSNYGWFIVLGVIGIHITWKQIQPHWRRWLQKRDEFSEASLHHKDPESIVLRQESLEAARRRLQEQHDRLAAQHAEKLKEREEEKRIKKIEEWDKLQQGRGFHSKYRVHETELSGASTSNGIKKSSSGSSVGKGNLRPEYNPLMGSGSGTSYRPTRRGGATGG